MFVVASDFNRSPFQIVGLDELTQTVPGVPGTFDDFVAYHEEEKMRLLLGNLFYDAFVTGLKSLPGFGTTLGLFNNNNSYSVGSYCVYVSQNFANASINNQAILYQSLTNSNLGNQPDISPSSWQAQPYNRWVALMWGDNYYYYGRPQKWYGMNRLVVPMIHALWLKWNYYSLSKSGMVVPSNENSDVVSPSALIRFSWNKFARLCAGDFPSVFDADWLVFPELENSLYGYLYLNTVDKMNNASNTIYEDLIVGIPGFTSFRAYLAYSFNYPGKSNEFGI